MMAARGGFFVSSDRSASDECAHRTRRGSARACPETRQESNLLRGRFDKTMMAGVAGVWVAVAMSGCVNVAQQGTQAGVAASGVPAASAAPPVNTASDAAVSAANVAALQASAAAAVARSKKSPPLVYRVRRGDTLTSIVNKIGCSSVQEVAEMNDLSRQHIKPGQTLKLPTCR